ncbi:discoidin domain-containing protein [Paenibacillus dendrobii]|nr:discoidin domain-containing protein [Paenibacillus dendrobii]
MRERRKTTKLAVSGIILALVLSAGTVPFGVHSASAAAEKFPTFVQHAVPSLSSGTADIAGTAFVDQDGEFHWMYSVSNYEQADNGGSWIKYNTNTDLGKLNTNWGTPVTYNSYWNRPGTINYKIDEAYGIPTPYQDDHNDGIGIWIDPDTGYWYSLTNDEYQFNPFASGNPTNNQRIATGIHNNRILSMYSTDKGATWNLIGQVATSPWNDSEEAVTASNFPGTTWSYGVAGTRLFVDNVNGYFYVLYNNHINWKTGYSNVLTFFSLARSPISAKMAEGSWDVWYNGTWTRSALKGYAGWIGSPMGAGSDHNLTVNYTPETDNLKLTGIGMDNSPLNIGYTKIPSGGDFTFKDTAGSTYTANTVNGTIVGPSGSIPSVTYSDPALDAAITVYIESGAVWIKQENNSTGYATSVKVSAGNPIFKNATTERLFVPVNTQYENAFSYNVYSGKYRSVGYDGYVYETDDLGAPDTFRIVGKLPAAVGSYLSQIDTGSLTNQQVSGYSFRTISDLSGKQINYSLSEPDASHTYYSSYSPPKDKDGADISPLSSYKISIGGNALEDGAADQWQFVPVPDDFDPSKNSGFYRLQNMETGKYLKVSGSTPAETRAMGASVSTGSADPNADPNGNGGNGAAVGSDQWYLLPVGNATPAYVTSDSSASDIAAATNTSLTGITKYRLVNRASDRAVEFASGHASIHGIDFGAGESQVMMITPSAANPGLPAAPTGLTATAEGQSHIDVTWNDADGATSYDLIVDGVLTSGAISPYAHTGLAASSTHTYQVRANNNSHSSQWSLPISATTLSGVISDGKTATASSFQTGNDIGNANDGNAGTRWAAVTNSYPQWWKVDLGSTMNMTKLESYWYNSASYPRYYQYKIEGSNDDVTYTTILDRTNNTTQGLTTDTFDATYRYVRVTITGSNYSGGSASSYEFKVYGEPVQTGTAPASPGNLRAKATGDNGIELNWNAVGKADGYNIYRSNTADGEYVKLNSEVPSSHTTYTDTGLPASTEYFYFVKAINSAGESVPSDVASAKTDKPHVTGISISPEKMTLAEGELAQLTAVVTPEEAEDKSIYWKSSDKGVAEVSDSGEITPKSPGTTVITATTFDGSFTASVQITVSDTTPPIIVLDVPGKFTGNHYNVGKEKLHVTGKISEPGVVFVNGIQADVEADLTFSTDIDLHPGMNRIEVTATDLAGNAAETVGYNVVPSK